MADGIGGPRKAYGTDWSDAQWEIMEPLIPAAKPGRRPREVDLREVIHALLLACPPLGRGGYVSFRAA